MLNFPKIESSLLTQREEYKPLFENLKPLQEMTDQEIMSMQRSNLTFDVESYENYFLIMFSDINSNKIITFEADDTGLQFNKAKLRWILQNFTCIGFNSINYDMHMIAVSLGMENQDSKILKLLTKDIIEYEKKPSEIKKYYPYENYHNFDHIDIINVCPLSASLKMYAGRLNCNKMQDLPYHHNKILSQNEKIKVKHYCLNDNNNTSLIYKELEKHIKLRSEMGAVYNLDLRSKSDAQIAEHVIKSEIKKITGVVPKKPNIEETATFKYNIPDFIKNNAKQHLKPILDKIENCEFGLKATGHIKLPKEILNYGISINKGIYTIGGGGLHSCEKSVCHKSCDKFKLIDADVASYYPATILNQKLYPQHLGEGFLKVYQNIVSKRLKAKKEGDKLVSDSLKITINGSFGKFGNKWSALYSPDLLIQTTITGQLALLLLTEMIENVGIRVVSANTDGIVSYCPIDRISEYKDIVKNWENITNYTMEFSNYKALYSRDVNNYIVIKEDGNIKAKGAYSEFGSALNSKLSKNPQNLICSDAVKLFLSKGIPIEQTIENCTDIRRFVTVRQVNGGAVKDGYFLGKVIRWYYKKNEFGVIKYKISNNKVPKSDGAWPLMSLPDKIPEDIDFTWYIQEAKSILQEIGFEKL